MKLRFFSIFLVGVLLFEAGMLSSAQTVPGLSVKVLAKSPSDTATDLQIFCLFRSLPNSSLHGSLSEMDAKLHGLLSRIRTADDFSGELGETILLTAPAGTIAAKKVLIIGLGDPSTFTPERMYLVGKIAFREANRLHIAHPFFAPTVLDGGVTRYTTGEVAEQVVRGMRDALVTESLLHQKGFAASLSVLDVTYLAGAQHVIDTQTGIDHAFGKSAAATH